MVAAVRVGQEKPHHFKKSIHNITRGVSPGTSSGPKDNQQPPNSPGFQLLSGDSAGQSNILSFLVKSKLYSSDG